MFPKLIKLTFSAVLFICAAIFLIACTEPGVVIVATKPPANTEVPQTQVPEAQEPTAAATSTPFPSPTVTPESLSLFLSEPLPQGVFNREGLGGILLNQDPNALFWFGPAVDAPDGDILEIATWVYLLAAPFPTLQDDVSLADLTAFWAGEEAAGLSSLTKLYIPVEIEKILNVMWGNPAENMVKVVSAPPEPGVLWEENAWAILPFEKLTPKLKVITMDGVSPLYKTFDPVDFPLSFQFVLVDTAGRLQTMSDLEQEVFLGGITATNRDPEKMTTLVMTGVTALVRATAYRMELYGVTYPGEKIVHWLSEADLTHISNEVSFYEDCPFPDPDSPRLFFCSHPKYIELLEFVGANIIELTGNHNNDWLYAYDVDVVPFTLALYEERGMAYFGGGLDIEEAKSPLKVSHNGNHLVFIGCNWLGPEFAWATEEQGGAAPCEDFQWMADEISRLREAGYLPIATFQYQEDYYNYAKEWLHVKDFGMMADAGAIIINGSQAHRPKAMDFRADAFIDYGLGNLFFDQMGYTDVYGNNIDQVRWEIIQRHTFYDGNHLHVELLTAMLEDFAQPRPMTEAEREIFLDELFTASGWISR